MRTPAHRRDPASTAPSSPPSQGRPRTNLGEPGFLLQVPLVGSPVRRVHVDKGVGLALALGGLGLVLLLELQLPVEFLVSILAAHLAAFTEPRAPPLLPPPSEARPRADSPTAPAERADSPTPPAAAAESSRAPAGALHRNYPARCRTFRPSRLVTPSCSQ